MEPSTPLPPTTREDALREFGPVLVGAMDEIAELVFATRLLVDAKGEYQALGIVKGTEASSIQLEQALHGLIGELLNAIRLGPSDDMADRLQRVRKANALRIAQAGTEAAELAAAEGEQVQSPSADDSPATTSERLQHRIERVAAAWATL